MPNGSSKPHKGSRVVNCNCRMRAPICFSNRSWRKGRRFYGCSQLEDVSYFSLNVCNCFHWYDEEENSGHVEDLKDGLKMLIMEIRKIKIENKELWYCSGGEEGLVKGCGADGLIECGGEKGPVEGGGSNGIEYDGLGCVGIGGGWFA
ncbi:hypothetical protein GQ457_09G013330 [Hibiscus cannabinus]